MGITAETILFYGASVRTLGGKVAKEKHTATRYDAITGEAKQINAGNKVRIEICDYVLEAIDSEKPEKINNDFDNMLKGSPLKRFQFDSNSYLIHQTENDLLDGVFIGIQVPFTEGNPIDDKLLCSTREEVDLALKKLFDCGESAKLHIIVNYS